MNPISMSIEWIKEKVYWYRLNFPESEFNSYKNESDTDPLAAGLLNFQDHQIAESDFHWTMSQPDNPINTLFRIGLAYAKSGQNNKVLQIQGILFNIQMNSPESNYQICLMQALLFKFTNDDRQYRIWMNEIDAIEKEYDSISSYMFLNRLFSMIPPLYFTSKLAEFVLDIDKLDDRLLFMLHILRKTESDETKLIIEKALDRIKIIFENLPDNDNKNDTAKIVSSLFIEMKKWNDVESIYHCLEVGEEYQKNSQYLLHAYLAQNKLKEAIKFLEDNLIQKNDNEMESRIIEYYPIMDKFGQTNYLLEVLQKVYTFDDGLDLSLKISETFINLDQNEMAIQILDCFCEYKQDMVKSMDENAIGKLALEYSRAGAKEKARKLVTQLNNSDSLSDDMILVLFELGDIKNLSPYLQNSENLHYKNLIIDQLKKYKTNYALLKDDQIAIVIGIYDFYFKFLSDFIPKYEHANSEIVKLKEEQEGLGPYGDDPKRYEKIEKEIYDFSKIIKNTTGDSGKYMSDMYLDVMLEMLWCYNALGKTDRLEQCHKMLDFCFVYSAETGTLTHDFWALEKLPVKFWDAGYKGSATHIVKSIKKITHYMTNKQLAMFEVPELKDNESKISFDDLINENDYTKMVELAINNFTGDYRKSVLANICLNYYHDNSEKPEWKSIQNKMKIV